MEVPEHIQEAVAREFLQRYPAFYSSAENAKRLREVVDQFTESGCSFSVDTLANAFHHLEALGALETPQHEIVEVSEDEVRRRHHIESLAQNAEKMTDLELEKSLRSAGIYVSSRSTI